MEPEIEYKNLKNSTLKYLEGVQEKLDKRTWTDFNTHDPGMTILDVLNYALTDLSYRTDLDIKDLIASYPGHEGSPQRELFNNHFPSPGEVLPSTPVTSRDYRKYMLDEVYPSEPHHFVARNIWFEKADCELRFPLIGKLNHHLSSGFTERRAAHNLSSVGVRHAAQTYEPLITPEGNQDKQSSSNNASKSKRHLKSPAHTTQASKATLLEVLANIVPKGNLQVKSNTLKNMVRILNSGIEDKSLFSKSLVKDVLFHYNQKFATNKRSKVLHGDKSIPATTNNQNQISNESLAQEKKEVNLFVDKLFDLAKIKSKKKNSSDSSVTVKASSTPAKSHLKSASNESVVANPKSDNNTNDEDTNDVREITSASNSDSTEYTFKTQPLLSVPLVKVSSPKDSENREESEDPSPEYPPQDPGSHRLYISYYLNGLYKIVVDLNWLSLPNPDGEFLNPQQKNNQGDYTYEYIEQFLPEIGSNTLRHMAGPIGGKFYAIEFVHPYWDEPLLMDDSEILLSLQQWEEAISSVDIESPFSAVASNVNLSAGALKLTFANGKIVILPISFKVIGKCQGNHRNLTESLLTNIPGITSSLLLGEIENFLKNKGIDGFSTLLQLKMQRVRKALLILKKKYMKSRNLCEDLAKFKAARVEEIVIQGVFGIEDGAEIEKVMADVFYQLSAWISPPVLFSNYKDHKNNLQKQMDGTIDKINCDNGAVFDGPALNHGFIDNPNLDQSDSITEIYTSDLINIIMDVKGIKWVDDFFISSLIDNVYQSLNQADFLTLANPIIYKPKLSMEKSFFVVKKGSLRYSGFSDFEMHKLFALYMNYYFRSLQWPKDLEENKFEGLAPLPKGNNLQILDYKSIQNDFPQVYGIGNAGLPENSTTLRRAQANQLKGYLFVIEQILSNYLAQVANVKALFEYDENFRIQEQTYYTKLLNEIPDMVNFIDTTYPVQPLQTTFNYEENPPVPLPVSLDEKYKAYLDSIVELANHESTADRKEVFVNHLMSRFGENLNEFTIILKRFPRGTANSDAFINLKKIKYIRALKILAKNRLRAFNYCKRNDEDAPDVWSTDNISFFEKRMCHKLALEKCGRWSLGDPTESPKSIKEIYNKLNPAKVMNLKKLSAKNSKKNNNSKSVKSLLLSSNLQEIYTKKIKKLSTEKPIKFNYGLSSIKKPGAKSLTNVLFNSKIFTKAQPKEYKTIDETICLIEHILLRPLNCQVEAENYQYLPLVQIDEEKLNGSYTDPAAVYNSFYSDPYSFHVSIIMPLLTEKFLDPEFQLYAERTIKNDLPAHIIPHIYWLEPEDYLSFERIYFVWLHTLCKYPFLKGETDEDINKAVAATNDVVMFLNNLNLSPLLESTEESDEILPTLINLL